MNPGKPPGPPPGARKARETDACTFCGRLMPAVKHLIRGPADIFICNECVSDCNQILQAEASRDKAPAPAFRRILPPREIKERLDQYVVG